MLNRKDLLTINQRFANGRISNASSLDFALTQIHRSSHWYRDMCLLARNILVDHIFEDGNKMTAAAVIMAYLGANSYEYNPDKIGALVLKITKSNIANINTIGRLIKNAIE